MFSKHLNVIVEFKLSNAIEVAPKAAFKDVTAVLAAAAALIRVTSVPSIAVGRSNELLMKYEPFVISDGLFVAVGR